jgi:hypothetical protein
MMAPNERVSLLDVKLELTRYLTQDDRAELVGISLPVVTIDEGQLEIGTLLATHNAFGATVVDGLVMNALSVGEHAGIQLLGPGDLLVPAGELFPEWLEGIESRTAGSVRLGLLGVELLAAAVRWPRIIQGLYACVGDQLQRLTAQLVICQLPRVDDRVLAMLWLMSESWGQVTPSGVRLPMTLTHETLGALVGAARPTVTLALRKLTADGAIVHQDAGWLLLEPPPEPVATTEKVLPPALATIRGGGLWTESQAHAQAQAQSVAYAELRETVRRLREEHRSGREQTREQLNRVRTARIHLSAIRKKIQEDALRRRPPPSS